MAKKKVKAARKRKVARPRETTAAEVAEVQQHFEGDGFPGPPPAEVRQARDEFLQAQRDSAVASEHKADRHERLKEVMKEHGITRVKLDGENKFFELTSDEKIKTRTIPKDKRDNGSSGD